MALEVRLAAYPLAKRKEHKAPYSSLAQPLESPSPVSISVPGFGSLQRVSLAFLQSI